MSTETGTRRELRISQRARELLEGFPRQTSVPTPGRITMSSGTPDFPTPAHIIAATKAALDAGKTTYTPWAGILELRKAIAEKLARENGIEVDAEHEVLVTTGTQEALVVIMQALLDPGDEVLIHAPYYDQYRRDAMIPGGVLVDAPTSEANAFAIDIAALEARITERTRAIIVITPSNPGAGIQSRETLAQVAALAQAYNLYVIADELYEKYRFDGLEHHSLAAMPGMRERTITINGFSKCYSMTGFRVGYIAGPEPLIRAMLPFKHAASICANAPAQYAALAALEGPQDWFAEVLAEYDRRRHFWMEQLAALGLSYGYPQGAYYVYFNVSSTGLSAPEFSRRLANDYGVVIGSGGVPGEMTYLRGSLATPMDKLREGFGRMAEAVANFRQAQ
jgi:aminotransferase